MFRHLTLALAASLAVSAPAAAEVVNFEYTRTALTGAGGATSYLYDMQFWIDTDEVEALGYTDTLRISNLSVNRTGRLTSGVFQPFGTDFVTGIQDGWEARDSIGAVRQTIISPLGSSFWEPRGDDTFVRFQGISDVEADMTWSYSGIGVPGDLGTLFYAVPFQERVTGFRTSAPVAELSFFGVTPSPDPVDPVDPVIAPVPLPAGFPLLLAALGGFAWIRGRKSAAA